MAKGDKGPARYTQILLRHVDPQEELISALFESECRRRQLAQIYRLWHPKRFRRQVWSALLEKVRNASCWLGRKI